MDPPDHVEWRPGPAASSANSPGSREMFVPPRSMSEDHTYDAGALDGDPVGRVGKVEAGSPAPTSRPAPPPPPPSAKVAADFAESAAMVKDILSVDSGGESAPTATDVRGDATPADPPAISARSAPSRCQTNPVP